MGIDDRAPSMAELQEADYGEGRDYVFGSPHLRHALLRTRIETSLVQLVRDLTAKTGHCRVLEIGAGHGTFTSCLVQAGAEVTVTEMSEPSVRVLERMFAEQPRVRVLYDSDGTRAKTLAADGTDLIVFVSVLHHIPDYLGVVRDLVECLPRGAAFYSVQDPMWYPDRSKASLIFDRGSYLLWRLAQGNFRRGLSTRWRRIRKVYDEKSPSDMVEYHVVRNGVNQGAMQALLGIHFDAVELRVYWSTQAAALQRLGDRLGWTSSFELTAIGRRSVG